MTRTDFLARLSSLWQRDNAKIVVQWLTMMRVEHLRSHKHARSVLSSLSSLVCDAPGTDAAPAQ